MRQLAGAAAALTTNARAAVPAPVKSALVQLVEEQGHGFRDHPMWLFVTTAPPHRAVVERLAAALELSIKSPSGGYRSVEDFASEIKGFVAW